MLTICVLESNCKAKDIKTNIELNKYDTGDRINYTVSIQVSSDKIKDRNIAYGTAWRIDKQIDINTSLGEKEFEHRIDIARSIASKILNPQGYDDILFIYFLGKVYHNIELYRFSVDELNDITELYGVKRGKILKYIATKNKSYAKENKSKLKEETKRCINWRLLEINKGRSEENKCKKNYYDRPADVAKALCLFNIMTNETVQSNSNTYYSMLRDFESVSTDFIKAINHYK